MSEESSVPILQQEIGTRISATADILGGRKSAAEAAGISEDMLYRYIRGSSKPPLEAMVNLAKAAKIQLDWLATGEGQMFKGNLTPEIKSAARQLLREEPRTSSVSSPILASAPAVATFWPNPDGEPQLNAWQNWAAGIDTSLFVPVIYAPKLCAAAGNGLVNYMDEQETEALMFKASFLRYMGVQPHQVFCMRVKGESMEPSLKDGCIVLVDTAQRRVAEGVFVLRMNDELLVKRLQPLPGGVVRVMSDNPAYASFEINLSQMAEHEIDIIGRAIHLNTKI
ncbi:helix-turn-helix transcriptional regulator [Chitinibacter sp. GC72]|uniref:LexA family transcriptional regulator n=1 Tax=Chitinibacter sp. GC72 TaxID=1526917 RepID=UPI0018E00298|nr:S24 family peptidase [Chitinibacter sp. GC72]